MFKCFKQKNNHPKTVNNNGLSNFVTVSGVMVFSIDIFVIGNLFRASCFGFRF